jgi:S-(hydroxymethyl)glutathione dehydrogenase/alcohol dehydrogenase
VVQAISGAKMMGASQIIGVDKNVMKKEKGEAFGMTHFINSNVPDISCSDLVKELTGRGVDYCIECTGVAPLLTESLEATKVVILPSTNNIVTTIFIVSRNS